MAQVFSYQNGGFRRFLSYLPTCTHRTQKGCPENRFDDADDYDDGDDDDDDGDG